MSYDRLKRLCTGTFLLLFSNVLFPFVPAWLPWSSVAEAAEEDAALEFPPITQTQLSRDLKTLLDILSGMEELEKRAKTIIGSLGKSDPKVYSQEENDLIRSMLLSYLNYRTALFRLVHRYQIYESIADPELRSKAFIVAYGSGLALFEKGLVFVQSFKGDDRAKRKLNEGDPTWGVPPNLYRTVRKNVANRDNIRQIREARAVYETSYAGKVISANPEEASKLDLLCKSIARLHESPVWEDFSPWDYRFRNLLSQVKSGVVFPKYTVQSLVATLIGNVRVPVRVGTHSLITEEQVQELKKRLQPGDIIIERRNWFLSNAFLPGFWPHAALYVGTAEDLRQIGLAGDKFVSAKLAEFEKPAPDKHEHRVIEALSEGVVFSSLEEATLADYIAVLRPKLPQEKVHQAISKAFSHHGKPYDFEFDFFSTDKIVCTELVYRCYDGCIKFDLVDVLGRRTLPAIEIVKKFGKEHQQGKAELDFVLFLDGDEQKRKASFNNAEEFIRSADRSAFTWMN